MYLIFDTETTGKAKNFKAPKTDTDNWPRMVQLSWQLHSATGQLLSQQDLLVQPEGFIIPFEAEKIHGISTQMAEEQGLPLQEVLDRFDADLAKAEVVVGHNVEFDLKVMGAEYVRTHRQDLLEDKKSYDTMKEATDFVAIPSARGFKYPKLEELHRKLFGEGFDSAHNAAFDVHATARCFFGLIQAGVATPPPGVMPTAIAYEAPNLTDSHRPMDLEAEAAAAEVVATDIGHLAEVEVAHLHVHSQYSILQSTAPVAGLVARAKHLGMNALALTDLGNMFGAYAFWSEATKAGIKPLIGIEVYMVEDPTKQAFTGGERDLRFQQVLIAKNHQGFVNLAKLSTKGYEEGMYDGKPRVSREQIAQYREHVIALSGGVKGEVAYKQLNVGDDQAKEAVQWWHDTFGEDFYLELVNHQLPENQRVNEALVALGKQLGIKCVATNDLYYLDAADAPARNALIAIDHGMTLDNPRSRGLSFEDEFANQERYFVDGTGLKQRFAAYPEAVETIAEVVNKVETYKLSRDVLLPNFPVPEGFADQDDYLKHLALEGAKERYGDPVPAENLKRIEYELDIVKQMGFPGYFLITADMINYGKDHGVMVGPGRGSAAGSVVAYCIGITNIDPIKYNLLFERFLNPERVSMPDIDTDFDDEGRQRVIDYVVEKYGKDKVAHIITFGKMAPKMAIRDTARVMELPLDQANFLAKLVPDRPGTTFEKAYKESSELKQLAAGNDEKARVLKMAEVMEGSMRNTGIHAAGVIIAPDDITNYIPACKARDVELLVTQFDGSVAESAGMLKMDFLGLKTLTIIRHTLERIEKNHGVTIDIDAIPLDDDKTFELYQRADTVGTFQFESSGMREHLKNLKPTTIEDLIAMNALYRPGPMEFIPNYIARKHGKEEVEYPHELLVPLLESTYGIMIYQEQIMQCAQIVAGFSLGKADVLRRAMGKKKMDVMAAMKEEFVAGAAEKHNIEAAKAAEIFGIMEKFAQYGFNRSHSAAYSVVAYQTGYLKANYPAEYMAAVLTNNRSNIDKITQFIEETRSMGIHVLGPSVNESSVFFDVDSEGQIRFGLGAVKGTGEAAVASILEERSKAGPFQGIFDFAKRVNLRAVNKKTFESLAQAGAFDDLDTYHRRQYLEDAQGQGTLVELAVRYGQRLQEEESSAQANLFGGGDGAVEVPQPKVPDMEPFAPLVQLELEKDVVGFYLSGHPLDQFRIEIDRFCKPIGRIDDFRNQDIAIGGIVASVQHRTSKKGDPFGIVKLEDFEGSVDMFLFSEEYLKHKHLLVANTTLYVRGKVEESRRNPGSYEFRPRELMPLSSVRSKLTKGYRLRIDLARADAQLLQQLLPLVESHPGNLQLKVAFTGPVNGGGPQTVETLSRRWQLSVDDQLVQELNKLSGVELDILQ